MLPDWRAANPPEAAKPGGAIHAGLAARWDQESVDQSAVYASADVAEASRAFCEKRSRSSPGS